MTSEAGLVPDDDMIQAFPAKGADHALDVGPLPRRARRSQDLFDPHRLDLLHELLAEDPVPVAEEIAGRTVPGKGLQQLMGGPFGGGMSRDGKVENAPALVRQHQEHVQNLKPDRRYREEVDRNHTLDMIFQEGSPGLGWRFPTANHVFAHARFAHVEAQLQEFTMNPRRAPEWILTAHSANQIANLLWHGGAPGPTLSNFPGPK